MTLLFLQHVSLVLYHAMELWLVLYVHGLQRETAITNFRV